MFAMPEPTPETRKAQEAIQRFVEEEFRRQHDRLEDEAQRYLLAGFTPDELLIVSYPNGERHIRSKAAIGLEE